MLRQQRVPARARVGFADYHCSETPKYWDHRVAEYWNERLNRRALVDAVTEKPILERLKFKIDPININGKPQFLLAGKVWQRCRAGKAKPQEFGDSSDELGMPSIRYALLQDSDYVNENELVGFDAWHELINKPESEVTDEDRGLLDEIAEVTCCADSHFEALRDLYQRTPYGQAIQDRMESLRSV